MKNVSNLVIVLLISCISLIGNDAFSQNSLSRCANWNQVATTCVGACGNPSTINYPVLCVSSAQRRVYFCVRNEATSLCPNNDAFVKIYVNGIFTASGNITALGSSVNFSAPCGSHVQVVASNFYNGNPIQCVWLGQVTVGLRRLN